MKVIIKLVVGRRTRRMVGQIGLPSYHETHCRYGYFLQCSLNIRVGVGLRVAARLTSGLMKTGHKSLELGSVGDWVLLVVGVGVA